MEKQNTLTSTQIGEIFAQIKATGNNELGNQIYTNFLPVVKGYAKMLNVPKDEAMDMYDMILSNLYNAVMTNVISGDEFKGCIEKAIMKEFYNFARNAQEKPEFQSALLQQSYNNNSDFNTMRKDVAKQEFMHSSFMFTVDFLNELSRNPELAQSYGLNETKINMVKDHVGLNAEGHTYSTKELAEKYQVTESRAVAMVVASLKAIRNINEFKSIKTGLKQY